MLTDVDGIYIECVPTTTAKVNRLWIYNNLVYYTKQDGIQVTSSGAGSTIDNVYIHNNTLYGFKSSGTTYGLITLQEISSGTLSNFYVRNNIAYTTKNGGYVLFTTGISSGGVVNYNLYGGGDNFWDQMWIDGTEYQFDEWAAYKSATSWDANSPTPANPLFADAPDDLRVNTGSPAIDNGVTIVGYTRDYDSAVVSNPPNIGAYATPLTTYISTSGWKNDSLDRYYVDNISAFATDIYFNESGSITYGTKVASPNAVLTGGNYAYNHDVAASRLYVNYSAVSGAGGVTTELGSDTSINRIVDTYGALHVSGRVFRNTSNDTINFGGVGVERLSVNWGFNRFNNDSYVQYARDFLGVKCFRVTYPVEVDRYKPEYDFHYTDSTGRIANMKEFVNRCVKYGVYVIINWHEFNPNQLGSAVAFWENMTTEFDGVPNVIFEIYNEPRNIYTWATHIKPYAETVRDAIRAIDVNSSIIILAGVPDYCADFEDVWDDKLTGTNIAYTMHFYAYADPTEYNTHNTHIVNGNLPVWMTEGASMNFDGKLPDGQTQYCPSCYSAMDNWITYLDTANIPYNLWGLFDKNGYENGMLYPETTVSATGYWDEATDWKYWGLRAGRITKAANLDNHVSIHIPSGVGSSPTTTYNDAIAHYNFEEASGNLLDQIGSDDGTVTGCTYQQTGKNGYAMNFDGSDQITMASTTLTAAPFTLAGWVKPGNSANPRALFGWSAAAGPEIRIETDDELAVLRQYTDYFLWGETYITDAVWTHIAFSCAANGDYVLYVNGTPVKSGNNTAAWTFSNLRIGSILTGEDYFVGEIDEVTIFNVVKSGSDITNMQTEFYGD
jgi:hypothetical protein